MLRASTQSSISGGQLEQSNKPRLLLTVRSFSQKHPAFSQPALRALIDKSRTRMSSHGPIPGNGLNIAIVRLNRRLLLDEEAFFHWLAEQNQKAGD
jgi:hypothetical protein